MPSVHLLADLGATNSRFAILSTGRVRHMRIFPADAFATPFAAITHYLGGLPAGKRPRNGALAVAAPIIGGRVTFVNRRWSFSTETLRSRLGFSRLHVINDLEAQAYALLKLAPGDCSKVGRGRAAHGAPMLTVGPGTGLGMAALLPDSARVIAGEGGHATLGALDADDARVLAAIGRRFGHVSAERALSGPGLSNLYRALSPGGRRTLDPAAIALRACLREDAVAVAAAQTFSRLLGGFCGNMALAFGALGGVYVVGGVVPGLGRAFDRHAFRKAFEAKGRYRDYLSRVPVFVVTRKDLGLMGLAIYLHLQDMARPRR